MKTRQLIAAVIAFSAIAAVGSTFAGSPSDGQVARSTLEHLRLLDRLQLHRQPPAWFIDQLLAGWGNPGSRWTSYVDEVDHELEAWRHVANLIEHRRERQARTCDEFDAIRRWLLAKGRNLELSKQRRRAGWSWLRRGARAWEEERRLELQLDPRPWPVPFEVRAVGDWVFVALGNDIELLDEARAMHNCVDKYGPRCRADGRVVISARKQGQRIAIMEVRFIEGAWHLLDAKGHCNSDLRGTTITEFEDFVRQIPPPAPINTDSLQEAIQDLARAEAVLADAEEQPMPALDDDADTGLHEALFQARIEVSFARLRVASRMRRYEESK